MSLQEVKLLLLVLCYALPMAALRGQGAPPQVRFHTDLGDIDVTLRPDSAPKTVSNFLNYVDRGDYNNSLIHRSIPGIFQGGGYRFKNGNFVAIPADPPVVNEFKISNTRGTLAMAKVSGDPNSATTQWYFNEADRNATTLDTANGGFTVFGTVTSTMGLTIMDNIGAVPVPSPHPLGPPFNEMPLKNYTRGQSVHDANFVHVLSIMRIPHPAFFTGEVALSNGVYYLQFPSGNPFGYYSYLSDQRSIYHFDFGYESLFEANDGKNGIYLYDFASGGFFYTSPTFPFPYLYDFSLNALLYYFPDSQNPGRYSRNPRYFYNFATGQIITK